MQVYKSNIYWFRITKATMNVMDGFSLNKITNPYFILFIYWSFTMVCVWMTNVVVERTFKMHIVVFKKTM